MDINLPGMDGLEATRRLRSLARPPIVILLSTYDEDEFGRGPRTAARPAYVAKSAFGTERLAAVWASAAAEPEPVPRGTRCRSPEPASVRRARRVNQPPAASARSVIAAPSMPPGAVRLRALRARAAAVQGQPDPCRSVAPARGAAAATAQKYAAASVRSANRRVAPTPAATSSVVGAAGPGRVCPQRRYEAPAGEHRGNRPLGQLAERVERRRWSRLRFGRGCWSAVAMSATSSDSIAAGIGRRWDSTSPLDDRGDAPALVVARGQQPTPRGSQLRGLARELLHPRPQFGIQPQVPERQSGLCHEVLQQPAFGRTQCTPGRHGHADPAHGLAVVTYVEFRLGGSSRRDRASRRTGP